MSYIRQFRTRAQRPARIRGAFSAPARRMAVGSLELFQRKRDTADDILSSDCFTGPSSTISTSVMIRLAGGQAWHVGAGPQLGLQKRQQRHGSTAGRSRVLADNQPIVHDGKIGPFASFFIMAAQTFQFVLDEEGPRDQQILASVHSSTGCPILGCSLPSPLIRSTANIRQHRLRHVTRLNHAKQERIMSQAELVAWYDLHRSKATPKNDWS